MSSSFESTLDTYTIKHRSISGAISFVTRTFLLYGIGAVALVILGGLLSQEEFGIFFIVEATVGVLIYFSDIGLAAALIQKKTPLTKNDLATTFTVQQALVLTLVLLALLFSNQIAVFFTYDTATLWLYKALIFSFFLSSLKTIPSVLIERDLEFNKLIFPQIIENLVFYTIVVFFAWQGRGVESYTFGVLARGIVGLVVIYYLKPWTPSLRFDPQVARGLISFGAPFQLNSILALLKDRLLIIFLGKTLGPGPVGLLGWAEKWAQMPIRFFADPVLRVTFPAFSKLRHQPEELKKAIEKSVFFVSILVFPAAFGMVAIAPNLIAYIPKYQKWQPALIALGLYSINTIFSSVSITLTNTLNATGKVQATLKLMIMWTILTWVLTPILINVIGYNGAALASALTSVSSIIGYYLVKRIVNISIIPQIFTPLICSIIMFIVVYYLAGQFAVSLLSTLVIALTGAIIYAVSTYILAHHRINREITILIKYLRIK